jgi:Transglutaminase-like superfamily
MTRSWPARKRFLIILAFAALPGLLVMSGLSCTGRLVYPASPVDDWHPATESEFKSYISPQCQVVEETLRPIVGDPPYICSQLGFDAIRNWVADNIAYESDEVRWGKDYWQTPEETLSSRTGDCEDFSILLCSLLRAYGIDAQQVYVALGVDGGDDGHAFVMEDWYHNGDWRRIESQAPAQLPSYLRLFFPGSHLDSRLGKYEITVVFNDVYCQEGPISWGEVQENSWIPTGILTAIGDVVRQLLQLSGDLLGLLFD